MGTNKYFNHYPFQRSSEQNLIEDLNREAIQIHGVDVIYLPRAFQKLDLIFGEDVISKFNDYYDIEMYIKNIDSFEGQGDIFKKFGLEVRDQVTFTVSRQRFDEVVGTELPRPREGDLIFVPFTNSLYEIRFVDHKSTLYQLGDYYVYELRTEQYNYSHHDLNTGIEAIDDLESDASYKIFLELGSGTGTFIENEIVYQGNNITEATAKATLIQALNPAGKLEIKDITGAFSVGAGLVKGLTSGASYSLVGVDEQDIVKDESAQNKLIEDEADMDVIDFTEDNPFSENDY